MFVVTCSVYVAVHVVLPNEDDSKFVFVSPGSLFDFIIILLSLLLLTVTQRFNAMTLFLLSWEVTSTFWQFCVEVLSWAVTP